MMRISARRTEGGGGGDAAARAGFSLLEILVCLLLLGLLAAGFSRILQGSLGIARVQDGEAGAVAARREAVRRQFAGVPGSERVIGVVEEEDSSRSGRR